jgi:hypothetical protein
MGMFDHFEPVPPVKCPRCGAELRDWQGKEEGCNQYLWRQREAAPVAHVVDEQGKWSRERLEALRLPAPEFQIYAGCRCGYWALLVCTCADSVWTESRLHEEHTDENEA